MQMAVAIVAHTPLWVFGLLALLIWLGIQGLRPRAQPIWRMLIVPGVFLAMGVSRLVLGGKSAELMLIWLASAAVLFAIALATGPRAVTIDRESGLILRPGSAVPLLRNVGIFLLQYAVAVVTAMKLDAAGSVAIAGQIVSGACAGYFLGWAIALLRAYRARPAETAAA